MVENSDFKARCDGVKTHDGYSDMDVGMGMGIMKQGLRRVALLTLLTLLSVAPAVVQASPFSSSSDAQRDLFRELHSEAKAGNFDKVRPQLAKLKDYPLYPWIEYEFLRKNFDTVSDARVLEFTSDHAESVMSKRLYGQWAARMAQNRDWSTLVKRIPEQHVATEAQCYRAQALIEMGGKQEGLDQGKALWLAADKKLPAGCFGMAKLLNRYVQLSTDDYWQRIHKVIDKNRLSFAKELAGSLSNEQRELVGLWTQVRKSPHKNTSKAFAFAKGKKLSAQDRERLRGIVVYGIERSADKKLEPALDLWRDAQQHFQFTAAEAGRAESKLGMWEAWRQNPAALQRLSKIPDEHRTSEGHIWLARIALRNSAWAEVLQAINAMEQHDPETAKDDSWRYWKARALTALNQQKPSEEARSLYVDLAENATFYGFLSADQANKPYARLLEPAADRSVRVEALQHLPAIKRWQEWMALGNRTQARKEWFHALNYMDKEGKLAAAELASKTGDANLAIWTVSRTRDWNIVDLRFPLLYQKEVLRESSSQGIAPAWVLGVMRRESAFDESAVSSAKALGLMQLMPQTARGVAKKLGIKVRKRDSILQPDTNIQLGSAYLREMYNRFSGNYVQATAAYNAGPHRIPKWLPDKEINADQWVESIPFNETRKYVRAVMAYTTIYDHKLSQQARQRQASGQSSGYSSGDSSGKRLLDRIAPVKPTL